jgi:hypothetical protein
MHPPFGVGESGTPVPAHPEMGIEKIEVKGIGDWRRKGKGLWRETGIGIGEKDMKRD